MGSKSSCQNPRVNEQAPQAGSGLSAPQAGPGQSAPEAGQSAPQAGSGDANKPVPSSDGRFEARRHQLDEKAHLVHIVDKNGKQLTWTDVIGMWKNDPAFADFYSQVLASSPFEEFYWECPPVNKRSLSQPFEHRTVKAPGFFFPVEPGYFNQYFSDADGTATRPFTSLGGDAIMVVPLEKGDRQHYGHIAKFVRNVAAVEQQGLWRNTAIAMEMALEKRMSEPTWLGTDGTRGPWLHVRMDSGPKYTKTEEYKDFFYPEDFSIDCMPAPDAPVKSSDGRFEARTQRMGEKTHLARIHLSTGEQMTWTQVIDAWKNDPEFALFYSSVLASSPFGAFYWECPPITKSKLSQPFEHRTVNVKAPGFPLDIDFTPFVPQFHQAESSATATLPFKFGDAIMVAPKPEGSLIWHYGNIAAFVQNAAGPEQKGLWPQVAKAVELALEENKAGTWLGAHGSDKVEVHFVHIRLDSYPKYTYTDEYKSLSGKGHHLG